MESNVKKSKKKIKNEYYNLKPNVTKKNNLRIIEPYEFKYQLYVKGRWVGKKFINVLETEFLTYNHEYFIKAINDGKILINGNKVGDLAMSLFGNYYLAETEDNNIPVMIENTKKAIEQND